jgi:outer membrane protein OmpA-like peptidoglycan-associated protein
MHWNKVLVVTVCAALIAACAGPAKRDVASAEKAVPTGTAFTKSLHKEYTTMAVRELAEADRESASYYAKKASSVASGANVAPEQLPAKLNYDEAQLRDARPRLISALDGPKAAKRPDLAAKAQVNFDCWLQEAAEIWWQPEDRKFCQTNFEAAMADLSEVTVATKAAPVPAAQVEQYLVFFDFDSAKLTPEAIDNVKTAADTAKNRSGARIKLIGHADRVGSPDYNLVLSGRRADAVKAELLGMGLSADAISTEAKGEAEPLVPTADGVAEPQNRRVEIVIQ